MENILQLAKDVASKAVQEAGALARDYFTKDKQVVEKGDHGDLVTVVDHLAEEIILKAISKHFPEHQIRSEETGWSGVEGDWLWLVDPLDGTNNYALGIPVYGVSVTLLYRKEPVLGVIYDSHLEQLYIALKGGGATCNDKPLTIPKPHRTELRKMTLGWIQGHQVQKNEDAMALKHKLDLAAKRVLRLWAPSLLWCMVARGDLDGIVLFNSEGDDLYAGILMAKEAGALVMDFEGNDFIGMNAEPYIIACHPEHKHLFVELAGR